MRDETATRVGREYPAAPLVGVAGVVVSRGEILLIRRGHEPMLGAWSLPGGLLELGETTREGAVREVFEETGVRVGAVEIVATVDRIVRDNAGRVQYHYVLIDWLCVLEKDASREAVCGDDAVAAKWATVGEIYSGSYGLLEATVGVIEQAMKLVEAMER